MTYAVHSLHTPSVKVTSGTYTLDGRTRIPSPQRTPPMPVDSNTRSDSVGWMSIETAPKDGTPILAYHPFTFADGTPDAICDVTAWDVRGGFWFNRTASNYYQSCDENAQPTHWMPLPTPPALEERRG